MDSTFLSRNHIFHQDYLKYSQLLSMWHPNSLRRWAHLILQKWTLLISCYKYQIYLHLQPLFSCSPKVATVKVTTLKATSFNPVDMFQSLSYFSGISDLLPASSSWYARFPPLTSQDNMLPCSPLGSGLGWFLLSPLLVHPPLPSHQTLEFLKPQC